MHSMGKLNCPEARMGFPMMRAVSPIRTRSWSVWRHLTYLLAPFAVMLGRIVLATWAHPGHDDPFTYLEFLFWGMAVSAATWTACLLELRLGHRSELLVAAFIVNSAGAFPSYLGFLIFVFGRILDSHQ